MTSSNGKCKHSPRYWPFVRGIHRSPANSPHKGQWLWSFFDLHPYTNCLVNKSRRRWFETPSHSLWCRCNVYCQRSMPSHPTNICTYHDSIAVVACATFGIVHFNRFSEQSEISKNMELNGNALVKMCSGTSYRQVTRTESETCCSERPISVNVVRMNNLLAHINKSQR